MVDFLFYFAVFAGSALMVFNIIRYIFFLKRLLATEQWRENRFVLYLPGAFLILFLVGYIIIGIVGNHDLVVAGVLLGGSIFVFLLLSILYLIVRRLQTTKAQLELRYSEMEKENLDLSSGALSSFHVNLTKDRIISAKGTSLYEHDVPGNSFREALLSRNPSILSQVKRVNTKSFLTEDLLQSYQEGHESAEEIILTRRSAGEKATFVRLSATMLEDPSSGDVLAIILEEDYNEKIILDTILSKALSFRYDIVCSIVDGRYQLIASGQQKGAKAILPSQSFGDYDDFLTNHVGPRLAQGEDHDAILSAMALSQISKVVKGEVSHEMEIRLEWEGETYYKHFIYYNVTSDVPFFVLLVQDTTKLQRERALQNDRLAIALSEARSANAAKTVFFSNMSHDIRTPMNAIIGFTELASRSEESDQLKDYLGKIASSSTHLLSLINDILEMGRIESGKMVLDFARTDLRKIMEENHALFALQMQEKGLSYSCECQTLHRPIVLTDRIKLNRVLMNLISNAYKFTPAGGEVHVSLFEEPMEQTNLALYVFRIKDTGIGMSKDFTEHVFEAYERERKSTVDEIQGTGLGMAITKSLVDMLSGDIFVFSEEGKGTEITVSLPMEYLAEEGDGIEEFTENQAKPDGNERDFTGVRVLVADDNEINLEIAALLLSERGILVDTAVNGKQAVDMILGHEPGYYQAALLDIQMPVMDGLTATETIRACGIEGVASMPIVACTANAFHDDIQMTIDAGMNACVSKPIDTQKLFHVLAELGLGK